MEAPDEAEDKVGRHNENSHSPPKMTECYSLCRSYTVLAHLPSRTQVLGAVGGSAVSESSPPEGGPPPERAEEEEEETLTADDRESSISGISDLLQGSVLGRVEDLLDEGRNASQPEAIHPEGEGEGEGGGAALADCALLSTSLDRPVELRLAEKGAGSEPPVTVVQLFQQAAERHAERKALCVKRVGVWKSWTYQRYQEESTALAKAFIKV